MGFLYWLNPLNWFRRRSTDATEAPSVDAAPTTHNGSAAPQTEAPARPTSPKTPAAVKAARCAATTATGAACKRSAQDGSKYCASHKGFRAAAPKAKAPATPAKAAPAAKATARAPAAATKATAQCGALTAAGDQCKRTARDSSKYCASHKGYRPPAKAAKKTDTKPVGKKVKDTVPSTRRTHVTHNGYKLYQKGNRFYFSKKSQAEVKKNGADPVYVLPKDRKITVTPNGLPVLKTK